MLDLRTENVDLRLGTMVGGGKTAAGKNRVVPIHPQIREIVAARCRASESGYLFEYELQISALQSVEPSLTKISSQLSVV
jgi:integrase